MASRLANSRNALSSLLLLLFLTFPILQIALSFSTTPNTLLLVCQVPCVAVYPVLPV